MSTSCTLDKLMEFLAATSSLSFSLIVLAHKHIASTQGNQALATCKPLLRTYQKHSVLPGPRVSQRPLSTPSKITPAWNPE